MLYNVASCWLYLKEYINDVRSRERQIAAYCFATNATNAPRDEWPAALKVGTEISEELAASSYTAEVSRFKCTHVRDKGDINEWSFTSILPTSL
jgi:hypothetical protein